MEVTGKKVRRGCVPVHSVQGGGVRPEQVGGRHGEERWPLLAGGHVMHMPGSPLRFSDAGVLLAKRVP